MSERIGIETCMMRCDPCMGVRVHRFKDGDCWRCIACHEAEKDKALQEKEATIEALADALESWMTCDVTVPSKVVGDTLVALRLAGRLP